MMSMRDITIRTLSAQTGRPVADIELQMAVVDLEMNRHRGYSKWIDRPVDQEPIPGLAPEFAYDPHEDRYTDEEGEALIAAILNHGKRRRRIPKSGTKTPRRSRKAPVLKPKKPA
jgi:hypothetical protein